MPKYGKYKTANPKRALLAPSNPKGESSWVGIQHSPASWCTATRRSRNSSRLQRLPRIRASPLNAASRFHLPAACSSDPTAGGGYLPLDSTKLRASFAADVRSEGHVHGRLSGAVGRRRSVRRGDRTRLEDEASPVSDRDRGQDDATARWQRAPARPSRKPLAATRSRSRSRRMWPRSLPRLRRA